MASNCSAKGESGSADMEGVDITRTVVGKSSLDWNLSKA